MKTLIGNPSYGYNEVNPNLPMNLKEQMEHYLMEASAKYHGKFVDQNIALAVEVLKGRKVDHSKMEKIVITTTAFLVALYTLPTRVMHAAGGGAIDTTPISSFSHSVWITMLQCAGIFCLPIVAWAGYTLLFAGASSEKRTKAKTILINLTLGLVFVAGASWLSHQLVNAASRYFG